MGCQQQHLGNVADSSERSPLSANSAKRRNSVLNPLSEEDHGSLEPLGVPSTAHRGGHQGIKLCFSSFIQPSFLLQSIPKTYSGKVAKENSYQLVEIYSPDLLAAQEELLQTISTAHELKDSTNTLLRERTQAMVQAARDKLLLWDLKPEQVAAIEQKGTISDRLTLYAPSSGIVIRKEAVEGKYVETGAPIYTIADLRHVWVQLDAYESDLVWLHFGQDV